MEDEKTGNLSAERYTEFVEFCKDGMCLFWNSIVYHPLYNPKKKIRFDCVSISYIRWGTLLSIIGDWKKIAPETWGINGEKTYVQKNSLGQWSKKLPKLGGKDRGAQKERQDQLILSVLRLWLYLCPTKAVFNRAIEVANLADINFVSGAIVFLLEREDGKNGLISIELEHLLHMADLPALFLEFARYGAATPNTIHMLFIYSDFWKRLRSALKGILGGELQLLGFTDSLLTNLADLPVSNWKLKYRSRDNLSTLLMQALTEARGEERLTMQLASINERASNSKDPAELKKLIHMLNIISVNLVHSGQSLFFLPKEETTQLTKKQLTSVTHGMPSSKTKVSWFNNPLNVALNEVRNPSTPFHDAQLGVRLKTPSLLSKKGREYFL